MKTFFKKLASIVGQKEKVLCPNCMGELNEMPTRKKKCPLCSKAIYIKSRPSDRKKRLVTEEIAKEIEKEWSKQSDYNKRMDFLKSEDLSEEDYEKEKKVLSKKFGKEASDRDIIWSLFNRLISNHAKDFGRLKSIYYRMALFLDEEKRDFHDILEQHSKMELMGMKSQGFVKTVKILATESSCDSCKEQKDKVMTVDEALKTMPLPCKDCSYTIRQGGKVGFCRCIWTAEEFL